MENIINAIRDILRSEGITGMDSINHCIIFLISRILDTKLCNKLGIDKKYSFKNILKNDEGDELGDQDFKTKIINRSDKNRDCLVHFIVNVIGFRNIKFKLESPQNLKLIYEKLKKLNIEKLSNNYDLIGTIYEIHLKTGTSNAMKDLGQYYTHRLVIKYMIELCEPKKNDVIVDPTMGTGGFLTMAIKYLNNKYEGIDWKKHKKNIIGFDIDENVRNMALLNIFLEIGELCEETLVKQDTLYYDMKYKDSDTIVEGADVILANEPMGLKNIVYDSCCERIKELKIKGTKAEPLFLNLFMNTLKEGGRCAVIVPDGILFNEAKQHKETRKYLIENFNLLKVISLNGDFFINTGVKTSILFFKNDEYKTKKVEFCEIKLKNDYVEENKIVEVNYKKLKENNYSLFINKYKVEEVKKIEDVEYKKLGEICKFLPKSKRPASYGQEEGKYPFYTSSLKVKYCDEADYNEECVIIGSGGNANIKYSKQFSCSADNFILNSQFQNIKYIYYYFFLNINVLENGFSGTTIKHISKEYIKDLEIPLPSLQFQELIVQKLDVLDNCIKNSEKIIEQYKQIIKMYLENTIPHDCEEKQIGDICQFLPKSKRPASYGQEEGKYPFYTSSLKVKYCDEADYDDECIIIGDGGNANLYFDNNFSCSDHNYILTIENSINGKYVFYYLKSNINLLNEGFKGSTIKNLSKNYVEQIKIPLPTLKLQKSIVKYIDNINYLMQVLEEQIDNNKRLMKNIINKLK